MAHNFHYYSPTEVIFGRGAHQETGKYIKKYGGTKVLVVYGSERVFKNGLMDEITESMKAEGLTFEFLGGVVPNPHLSKVYMGIGLGKKIGADPRLIPQRLSHMGWQSPRKMSGLFSNTPVPQKNVFPWRRF